MTDFFGVFFAVLLATVMSQFSILLFERYLKVRFIRYLDRFDEHRTVAHEKAREVIRDFKDR